MEQNQPIVPPVDYEAVSSNSESLSLPTEASEELRKSLREYAATLATRHEIPLTPSNIRVLGWFKDNFKPNENGTALVPKLEQVDPRFYAQPPEAYVDNVINNN